MILTRKQQLLLGIEVAGFIGATALLFTRVPFWISAIFCGCAYGLGLVLVYDVLNKRSD